MKQLNKLLLLVSVVFCFSSSAKDITRDGLPTPWPFPWAVDCPMAWDDLNGLYNMSDSNARDQILVKVNQGDNADVKVIRVVRLSSKGRVRAFGLAMAFADEKEFSVHMIPTSKKDGTDTLVTLRMYYASNIVSCSSSSLVPIMTVSHSDSKANVFDYVLIRQRVEGEKKN